MKKLLTSFSPAFCGAGIFCFLISIFYSPFSFSQQAPGIEWQNTIGGTGYDQLYSIQQTNDGGYILGGYSTSGISGDKTENTNGSSDYWMVKTDATGIIQWQNNIGGSSDEDLRFIQQTSDGGYILAGHSLSNISGDKTENNNGPYPTTDYWIVKTDATGNIQWQNTIGGSGTDAIRSAQQTSDGGYILGGYSWSNISGDKTENSNGDVDYWIVKTDASGNIQWQNTIGGSDLDWLYSLQQTGDGGYILGGTSFSNISGDKTENRIGLDDYWIVKTDASGNIQWQNTIGGNSSEFLYSVQQTSDGGYFLGGHSSSGISGDKTENSNGAEDYWIVKTDATGNIQWQNTIGGSGSDWLYSIRQTNDGGYVLGGSSGSNISGDKTENNIGAADYWVVKTDLSGNIQWQSTIGGSNGDLLNSIEQTSNGGYILGGYSDSNISGNKTENSNGGPDYWIVKISAGCAAPSTPGSISGAANVCSNQSGVVYSVGPVAGATSYQWTLPAGASGSSVTNSITVNFSSFAGGNICVAALSGTCASTPSCLAVAAIPAPAAPTIISGVSEVCPNQTGVLYSVPPVANATSYFWTLPPGASGSSSTGAITVNFSSYTGGNICAQTVNLCGIGPTVCKTVNVTPLPATPSSITGPVYPCANSTGKVYTCTAVSGAFAYLWTVPGTASIITGGGTNSITVNFSSTFTLGTITVQAYNCSGYGGTQSVNVYGKPPTPGAIGGPSTFCAYQQGVVYFIAPLAAATSYNWLEPAQASVASGQGTNSIIVNFGNKSGKIKVNATNSCGTSAYKSKNVTKTCKEGEFVTESGGDWIVYPNPAFNQLNVEIKNMEGVGRITIYNALGEMKSVNANPPSGSGTFEIDVNDLPAGIYFIILTSDHGTFPKKFVKQ